MFLWEPLRTFHCKCGRVECKKIRTTSKCYAAKQPNISKSDLSNHIVGLLQHINHDKLTNIHFVGQICLMFPNLGNGTLCIPLTPLKHLFQSHAVLSVTAPPLKKLIYKCLRILLRFTFGTFKVSTLMCYERRIHYKIALRSGMWKYWCSISQNYALHR